MKSNKIENLFELEAIEPRLMLSADPVMGFVAETFEPETMNVSDSNNQEAALAKEDLFDINFNNIQLNHPQTNDSSADIFSGLTDTSLTQEPIDKKIAKDIFAQQTWHIIKGASQMSDDAASQVLHDQLLSIIQDEHYLGQDFDNSDVITIEQSDILTGEFDLNATLVNNGRVSPGHSPGIQNVDEFIQGSSGILEIEIGGDTPGSGYDQVNVDGAATLDGTLNISFIDDFTPTVGDIFDIMNFDSVSGYFSTATGLLGFGDGSLYLEIVESSDKLQLVTKEMPASHVAFNASTSENDRLGVLLNKDYFHISNPAINIFGIININDYVYLKGNFSFEYDSDVTVNVNTGLPSDLDDLDETEEISFLKDNVPDIDGISDDLSLIEDMEMNVIKIGANDVDAFIGFGSGSYFVDSNSDGIIDSNDTPNENAQGFVLENFEFGLALFDPVLKDQADYDWIPSFYAAKGTTDSFKISGFDENNFAIEGSDISLDLNSAEIWPGGYLPSLDFKSSLESNDDEGQFNITVGAQTISLDYDTPTIDITVNNAHLNLYNFLNVQGDITFQKDSREITLSDGDTTDVDLMLVAANDVNAFAGINGPSTNDNALGFELQNLDLALAMMTSSDELDHRSWTTVKASADQAAFIGNDNISISSSNFTIDINQGSGLDSDEEENTTVVDYQSSPLSVEFENEDPILIDFDGSVGSILQAKGDFSLNIYDFFNTSGEIAIEKITDTITTADDDTIEVERLTLGANGLDAFIGLNGPADNANAMGFSVSDVNFALALMSETDDPELDDPVKWTSLKAEVGNIQFSGLPDMTVVGDTLTLVMNQVDGVTSDDPNLLVIDYSENNLDIATGADTAITFDMSGEEGELIRASGNVEIAVSDFFFVQGALGFEKSSKTVTLADDTEILGGIISYETEVDTDIMTVGGEGLSAFVGIQGSSDEDALGLSLSNVNFGLAMMTSTDDPESKWTSLKANSGAVELVGIDDFTLGASTVSVEVNTASLPTDSVVDYDKTSLDIVTGPESTITLDMSGSKGKTVKAVFGDATLAISDYIHISGSFYFENNSGRSIDVVTGLNESIVDENESLQDSLDGIDGITSDYTRIDELSVDALTIGSSNVQILVGGSTPDDAFFALENINFALGLYSSTLDADPDRVVPNMYSLYANWDQLLEMDLGLLEMSIDDLTVEVNKGSK